MKNTPRTTASERAKLQMLDRSDFEAHQLSCLNSVLQRILSENKFYQPKLRELQLPLSSLKQLAELPLTTKQELVGSESEDDADIPAGYAKNLTFEIDQYCRLHRTSGTKGSPMIVLDTAEDWTWWMEAWQNVLDSADLESTDRVLMAFSFGPFIGFWSAFDAAVERGCLVAPTGAMSTVARLDLIKTFQPTVMFCTPSYALHMAEVAQANQTEIANSSINTIIVAGEPGGSIPTVRSRIESLWKARVVDHAGASEVGPWGFANPGGRGIHINEAQFVPEFLELETGQTLTPNSPESEGVLCELVLTVLGRFGSPVIRYRTGDLVKPSWQTSSAFVMLEGGVLGRTDDMMIIRGVNVFPSAIEHIIRGFPVVDEFRLTAFKKAEMDQIKIEVEGHNLDENSNGDIQKIRSAIEQGLGLRVEVEAVESNSLPRFELKGKRFIDQR
jgi:phenylacetate-CoA ligase